MAKKAKKRKYSKGAAKKVGRAMKKRKTGTLKSGRSGRKVKSKKQRSRSACPRPERRGPRSRRNERRSRDVLIRRSEVSGGTRSHPIIQQLIRAGIIERAISMARLVPGMKPSAIFRL